MSFNETSKEANLDLRRWSEVIKLELERRDAGVVLSNPLITGVSNPSDNIYFGIIIFFKYYSS